MELRRLPWVDVILLVLLVMGAVVIFSASPGKSNSEEEKVRLEAQSRAVELALSDAAKGATLEGLRQSLEQARSALSKTSLPGEAEALAVTPQILQYAKKNNITITVWDSGSTATSRQERTYSAVSHSLTVEGRVANLIAFSEVLTQASVVPVVLKMDITGVEGKKDILQMELELLIYYR